MTEVQRIAFRSPKSLLMAAENAETKFAATITLGGHKSKLVGLTHQALVQEVEERVNNWQSVSTLPLGRVHIEIDDPLRTELFWQFNVVNGQLVYCQKYVWLITKDFLPDPDAQEGTSLNATRLMGPRHGLHLTAEEVKKHPKRKRFRMLDDDQEIYYEGFLVDLTDEHILAPLDDFGTPNAGATTLQIWDKGWKSVN